MSRPEHIVGLSMICFDSNDPPSLAAFWAALLGGTRVVDDTKNQKNRLHLDIHATHVEAAAAEALALGATRADDVYDGGRWQVLRDPEGNEFCLLPPSLSL
jgi:predicted enzyme related to lactoylglutathione lyase